MAEYNSSYTGAQIDSAVAKAHSHTGNITESGTLQTTDVTIADGDKLVVTDASDSNKVARASISFNGTTTTKALTQKGTFETFARPSDLPTTMVASGTGHAGGLVPDPPETAGTLKYLREDGTWSEPEGGYVPTLLDAPTSGTVTYVKDGQTKSFVLGQLARVAGSDGYDFYQLIDLTLENSTITATWTKMEYANTTYQISVNGNTYGDSSSGTSLGAVYGPVSAGTQGQVLFSNGSGAPVWANKPTYKASEVMSISSQSISANTSSSCSITGSGNAGKAQTIIYVNSGSADYTVTVPTTYKTPDGAAIELTCPAGGYCEVSYLNISGTIYARGL